MEIYRGTNIVRDGLIFGYDTGYSLGNLRTSNKYYSGPPVYNLVPANVAAVNGVATSGGASCGNWVGFSYHSSYGIIRCGIVIKDGRPNACHMEYIGTMTAAGDTYPTFQLLDESGNTLTTDGGDVFYLQYDWKPEGSQFLISGSDGWSSPIVYGDGWKLGTSMSGTPISDVSIYNGRGWHRRTYKFTAAAVTGQTPLVRFSCGYKQVSGGTYNIWFDNISMTRDYPSRHHVDGGSERLSTNSLLDLKKTNDIDISNVSFDDEGQMKFNGIDDFFSVNVTVPRQFSLEVVMKRYTTPTDDYESFVSTNETNRIGISTALRLNWRRRLPDASYSTIQTGTNYVELNKYYHIVITYDGNFVRFYKNGELTHEFESIQFYYVLFSSKLYVGKNATNAQFFDGEIPITKPYDKIFSAAEVSQNYNTYKNRFDI